MIVLVHLLTHTPKVYKQAKTCAAHNGSSAKFSSWLIYRSHVGKVKGHMSRGWGGAGKLEDQRIHSTHCKVTTL